MILVISNKWDVTVDFVILELQKRRHRYARLNSEDLGLRRARISLPNLSITIGSDREVIDVARDVHVIWNRRPGYPFDNVPEEERPPLTIQRFVSEQWRSWRGACEVISGIRWVNPPGAELLAENKIRQLVRAQEVGFRIPKTIITNDPEAIRDFTASTPKTIAKALSAPLLEHNDRDEFIFTNELKDLSGDDDEAINICPLIVQERIQPKVDYRVTVIGDRVFTVRIQSNDDSVASLDWRTQKDGLSFQPVTLPSDLHHKCISLVSALGLVFGAIDLVERNGEFFFLEINPNGEWGWLQKPPEMPIAETMTDFLISSDRARS